MVKKTKNYAVKDLKLAKDGRNLIHWAEDHMPVLMRIRNWLSLKLIIYGLKWKINLF